MVMFKARFQPMMESKTVASAGGTSQQQQQPQPQPDPDEKAPPIEKEQGPQIPVKLPGPPHEPERARELSHA
jgi:hypothetical protein